MRYRLEYWAAVETGPDYRERQVEPGWYECDDWLHMVDAWQATCQGLRDHGGAVLMDESRQELLSCIHCDKSELLGTDATDQISGAWAVPGKTPREILMVLWDNAKAEYEARRRARRQRLPAPAAPQPAKPEPQQSSQVVEDALAALRESADFPDAVETQRPLISAIAAKHPDWDWTRVLHEWGEMPEKNVPLFAAAGA